MSQIPVPLPAALATESRILPRAYTHSGFAAWCVGAILFVSLAAATLLVALEWEHYRRILNWHKLDLTASDRAIVGWLLWSKTVLPLLPVLASGSLIAASGRRKAASVVSFLGATSLLFWLASDLVLQRLTGSHVLDYLPYATDALTASDQNHTQWAGDVAGVAWRFTAVFVVVATGAAVLWRVSQALSARLVDRWLHGRCSIAACSAAFVLVAFAAVPAQVGFSRPLLLRRVHAAMPLDLALFIPHANDPSALARLMGRNLVMADRGVRIISLVPDPASEDDAGQEQATLHNFADHDVSLDGWRLLNRAQQEHALSGTIAAGQSVTIVFPPHGLQLSNDGDELILADADGHVRHQVRYKRDHLKYGGVIVFREEGDLDDFLLKTSQGVQAVYRTMREDVLTPRPADDEVRLDAASPPHIVYLVLESFRASAVSPQLLKRLDEWSQQGLRLERHYAGSNSSHWGLFALLYGRSPLVYEATVASDIPPQTTHTLRNNGYHCTFITSGDCTHFRKMERFLNEERFDRVIEESGYQWREWPQRDRRALLRVHDVLAGAGNRPQFVMAFLMSTHFPYVFPPEWDLNQPSGADAVTRDNWKSFDVAVLHNRYNNAAMFLEEELMRLVQSLDPKRHIIVVTGDHGESMGEDGALAHPSRGSEVQTRVPMLIVGPGLPASVIQQPTTHTDLLPTLLHALSGHEVKLRHAHGRDVLADSTLSEQVMICPYRWKDPYDLILMRGSERMQLKIRLDRASVEALGFCDTSGNLDLTPERRCTPKDAVLWTEAFRHELLRIAQ